MAYRLREDGFVNSKSNMTFNRHRDEARRFSEFALVALVKKIFGMFFNKTDGLLTTMVVHQYKPDEWHRFMDSCRRRLKFVLLHNGMKFACVPSNLETTTLYSEDRPSAQTMQRKTQMDGMCRLKNCQRFARETRWLCQIAVLPLPVGYNTGKGSISPFFKSLLWGRKAS